MLEDDASLSALDRLVLEKYPYPIAVNYRRMLEAPDWPTRVHWATWTYDYVVRLLSLVVISQYLIRDADRLSNEDLNKLLTAKLPLATIGTWKEIPFAALRAYERKRDLFYLKEFYDLYWDRPRRKRVEISRPYDRLVSLRNDYAHAPKRPVTQAEWRNFAGQFRTNLDEILRQLEFLQHYSLIRVVGRRDDEYDVTSYVGEEVRPWEGRFDPDEELQPGWFYLYRPDQGFLRLHPLLVFWERTPVVKDLAEPTSDTGIINRFQKSEVEYILLRLQEQVRTWTLADELTHLIYYTIEQVKQEQLVPVELNWATLRDATRVITRDRFGSTLSKYDQRIYLQRTEAWQTFQNFLDSDKPALLLLGKSGVGKSAFLASLLQEFEDHDEICLLMYDGARVGLEKSLSETIGGDLASVLRLSGKEREILVRDLLDQISRIGGINERTVVLVVDAINENPKARDLVRQLDELYSQPPKRSWLKVVFSSRPEAWRTIQRHAHVSEHRHYRRSGSADVGVELQNLSYGVELGEFVKGELPLVYENYRQVFGLETNYADLSRDIRRMLSDPLALKLIAQTYSRQPIPRVLRPGDVYRRYIDRLVDEDRLREIDVLFLADTLVPLFISDQADIPKNELTLADLKTPGEEVVDRIINDGLHSDGTYVNQSFLNLANAEILRRRGEARALSIDFKYERFYDYFIGDHIFLNPARGESRTAYFLKMIQQTTPYPFLWGGVKSALIREAKGADPEEAKSAPIREAKQPNPELVTQLCFTEDQRVKETMVATLVDLGADDRKLVEEILRAMMAPAEAVQRSRLRRLFRRSGPVVLDPARARREVQAQKIAIEAASALGLPAVLHTGAISPDSTVRTWATRYIFHLWQREPGAGFELLRDLAQEAIRGAIPNFGLFEEVFALSFMILFEKPRDQPTRDALRAVWRPIIGKYFGGDEGGNRLVGLARGVFWDQVFGRVFTLFFRLISDFADYSVVTYKDANGLFHLSAEEKAAYRRLVYHVDPDTPLAELERDLMAMLEVTEVSNLHVFGMILMALNAHIRSPREEFLGLLARFFTATIGFRVPTSYPSIVPIVLCTMLDHDPRPDDAMALLEHTSDVWHEYSAVHKRLPGNNVPAADESTHSGNLGPHAVYTHQRTGTARSEFLERHIQEALARRDPGFFKNVAEVELSIMGGLMGHIQPALDVLRLIFPLEDKVRLIFQPADEEMEEKWRKPIKRLLAELRVRFPDEVDDFLEEQGAPEEYRLAVKTNEPKETVGGLMGYRVYVFLRDEVVLNSSNLRDEVVLNSPDLRKVFVDIFDRAADCRNLREWMDYTFRQIVNLVYGKPVLRMRG